MRRVEGADGGERCSMLFQMSSLPPSCELGARPALISMAFTHAGAPQVNTQPLSHSAHRYVLFDLH